MLEDRACTVEEVAAVAQVVQALTSRVLGIHCVLLNLGGSKDQRNSDIFKDTVSRQWPRGLTDVDLCC